MVVMTPYLSGEFLLSIGRFKSLNGNGMGIIELADIFEIEVYY